VACLSGGTVTNLGHRGLTLEASTHVTINTLGLSPRFLVRGTIQLIKYAYLTQA
jgi:hypothetical protein